MNIFRMAPGQIVFQGQNLTRALALGSVRKHVIEQCRVHELDADDMLVDVPGRVLRAWWTDEAGFVQEEHEGAIPVTVVNVANDERVFGARQVNPRSRNTGKVEIL